MPGEWSVSEWVDRQTDIVYVFFEILRVLCLCVDARVMIES